jgi:hypothetical protein
MTASCVRGMASGASSRSSAAIAASRRVNTRPTVRAGGSERVAGRRGGGTRGSLSGSIVGERSVRVISARGPRCIPSRRHGHVSVERSRMLELRPNCECRDRDLAPQSAHAWICSFECTFCSSCAANVLANRCPNCGGELMPRPPRRGELLKRHPASTLPCKPSKRRVAPCCDAASSARFTRSCMSGTRTATR